MRSDDDGWRICHDRITKERCGLQTLAAILPCKPSWEPASWTATFCPELTISVLLLFHNGHPLPEKVNARYCYVSMAKYLGGQSGSAWGLGVVTLDDGICTHDVSLPRCRRKRPRGEDQAASPPSPPARPGRFSGVYIQNRDQISLCATARRPNRRQGVIRVSSSS